MYAGCASAYCTTPVEVSSEHVSFTGTTWMWIGFNNPNQTIAVAPRQLHADFNDDGTVNIKADCNNSSGSYSVDGNALKIEIGAMTMAMCPPESRSDDYIKYLNSAASYFFKDGLLYIDLMADSGRMTFASSDVVMADDGEGALSGALWANPWKWVSFTNPVEQFEVESSENYLLTFHEDGTVEIKAECNNAGGNYSSDGSKLSIVIGPTTLAACPPGSRSDDFLKYLGASAIYFFKNGNLFIDTFADGGTLELAPVW